MVGFETDLGPFQDVDEMAMILGGNVALEPPLDGGYEAGELGRVLVLFPAAVDGGGELVQELLQIVFHVSTLSLPRTDVRRVARMRARSLREQAVPSPRTVLP